MRLLKRQLGIFPVGVWIAFAALTMCLLGWIMQAYSLINWEHAVEMGLQNHSLTGSPVEQAWAAKERGEAIADLLWPLPLLIVSVIGIVRKNILGFTTAMMEFAICIYFPLFYLFQVYEISPDTVLAAIILWGIPSILGIAGLWINRSFFLKTQKS